MLLKFSSSMQVLGIDGAAASEALDNLLVLHESLSVVHRAGAPMGRGCLLHGIVNAGQTSCTLRACISDTVCTIHAHNASITGACLVSRLLMEITICKSAESCTHI